MLGSVSDGRPVGTTQVTWLQCQVAMKLAALKLLDVTLEDLVVIPREQPWIVGIK